MRTRTARLLAAVFSAALACYAADPMLGTWKLNLEKSKYSPGPTPKSQIRVYETTDEGTKETVTTVGQDGETVITVFPANYDGRDYPVTGSSQYDTVALHRTSDYTAEAELKHAGHVIATARRVISDDGQHMVITLKSTWNPDKPVNILAVYDKQ